MSVEDGTGEFAGLIWTLGDDEEVTPESELFVTEFGDWIYVHPASVCTGTWCVIHRPMPGPWSAWPRLWRYDRGIMERRCPCETDHPVAEMYEHYIATGRGIMLVHGCCLEHQCGPGLAEGTTEGAENV